MHFYLDLVTQFYKEQKSNGCFTIPQSKQKNLTFAKQLYMSTISFFLWSLLLHFPLLHVSNYRLY